MQRQDWEEMVPHSIGRCLQTFDPKMAIKQLSDELGYSSVIDLGCGHGRLCEAFDPKHYLGIDIDQKVLEIAKKQFQNYQFEEVGTEPKSADIYIAHSTFSFLSDKEIDEALKKARCKWLILGEEFGGGWRFGQINTRQCREKDEYIRLLRHHDFVLHKQVERPYEKLVRVAKPEQLEKKISFLVFRKCLRNPFI